MHLQGGPSDVGERQRAWSWELGRPWPLTGQPGTCFEPISAGGMLTDRPRAEGSSLCP